MTSDAGWIRLNEAVAMLEGGDGGPATAKVMLAEWLRDGLICARADRLIEHRLVMFNSPAGAVTHDPLGAAIAAGVLPVWEWPTELAPVEAPCDMSAFNWAPIPADIADRDFWETCRMTCDNGDGTRARREYIGIRVEHSKLVDAAGMYDVPCGIGMLAGGVVEAVTPPVPRAGSSAEVAAFGVAAVAKGYSINKALVAVQDLWDKSLAPLKRDDAREAIRAAQQARGMPTGPGRRPKSA